MITRRAAADRGHFDFGWLDTSHTFSLIDAAPTVDAVVSGIKAGHVSVVSRPLSLARCASILAQHALGAGRERARSWLRPTPPAPQTILTPR